MMIVLVFFLINSQVVILSLPDTVTQTFRPILIAMILVRMMRNGSLRNPTRAISFLAAVHAMVVLLFYPELWNRHNILEGGAVALFFLMHSFAIGVNWDRRELRWILFTCFLGCFVCAVALLASNDPTDFHAGADGLLKLMGTSVNRNKNAYQYSFGVVLGIIYLIKGRRIPKLMILIMTAIMGYALLYSQCRGAFLSFVGGATVLAIVLLLQIRKNNSGKAWGYALLLIIAYIVIYYLLKNSELSRLVDAESKSGRDTGIEDAWKLFLASDWFGKVFGNGFGYETLQTGAIGAHFVLVGFLVSMGIIGSGLTALMFISTARHTVSGSAAALLTCAFLKTFFEGADYNVFIPLILSTIISNYIQYRQGSESDLFSRPYRA